jgi:uncharacterized protein involved in exopolysaccharide biosynthesis
LAIEATHDLRGLRQLLNQELDIASRVSEVKRKIEALSHERRLQRLEEETAKAKQSGQTKLTRNLSVPAAVSSVGQLDELIQQLQALRAELAIYSEIEVTMRIED